MDDTPPAAPPGHTDLPAEPSRAPSTQADAARRVVDSLFGPVMGRTFAVRYWDGTTECPEREPAFTLVLRHPGALRRMLLPPSEIALVEAFLFGDVDVLGDVEAAADLGDLAGRRIGSAAGVLRVLRQVLALPSDGGAPGGVRGDGHGHDRAHEDDREDDRDGDDPAGHDTRTARRPFWFARKHSARRDARAVRFHYDVGNAFYALWLDRQMVYSCGYFARGGETLDDGQTAKLDYVCRKLRLRPGERLLDIGCGWGALVIHAARHYGVRVTGITLSGRQAAFARERVAREGLADRVTIEVRDYRELDAEDRYDKIASVGMVEHVGAARLAEYFAAAYRALAPGGLFLNHGIVSVAGARPEPVIDRVAGRVWRRGAFIDRYVFPDGELVPAATVIGCAEGQGFELRDVESLREHYVTTLRHWVRRLEAREAEARAIVGDVTYRVWRLYMAASAYGFRTGRIGVIQSLLAKQDAAGGAGVPRTREDLYATPPASGARAGGAGGTSSAANTAPSPLNSKPAQLTRRLP